MTQFNKLISVHAKWSSNLNLAALKASVHVANREVLIKDRVIAKAVDQIGAPEEVWTYLEDALEV